MLVDAVLGRGLADVIQDPRPVGDRLGLGPRLERIAEREHVAVGADAGIAKQVPGAADAVAALENDVALARAFLLQMKARADAGQAGADDQNVEMFDDIVVSICPAAVAARAAAGIARLIRRCKAAVSGILGHDECQLDRPFRVRRSRPGMTPRTLNTGSDPP